jgi:peptidoglycan-associated lipoprotein
MQKEPLMKKLNPFSLSLLLVICLALFGCESGQVKKETQSETTASTEEATEEESAAAIQAGSDSDSGKACDNDNGCLRTVNFPFDSSALSTEAKDILDDNANFLKIVNDGKIKIQIEGHCDERGSIQYNLALGERRANSVKNYLVALGVDANNVSTISHGKERELASGHDEGSWAKNRRANFVVE